MDSNSSEESSVSDYSTESSDEDGMEAAQINGTRLLLPQGLCDKGDVFKEFFSPHLWNSLSDEHKTHLQSLLPKFPENDEEEKTVTLQRLFNFETFKFSSPLEEFHSHLRAGYFRPDIARMRYMIRKAEHKEAKHRYKNHKEKLKREVLSSRKRLLHQIKNLPPGSETKYEKRDVTDLDLIRHRTKQRYFQVISSVRSKTEDFCSSDENYLENTSVSLSRKQKRHLNSVKNSLQHSDQKFFSTVTGKSSITELERCITPNSNPFYINEEVYHNLLRIHKKRKQEDPDDLEYSVKHINLSDVIQRTQLPYLKIVQVQVSKTSANSEHRLPSRKKIKKEPTYNYNVPNVQLTPINSENESDSDSIIDAVTIQPPKHRKIENKLIKSPKIQPVIKPVKVEVKLEPEEVTMVPAVQEPVTVSTSSNMISPISSYSQYGKIMPVTLSDLEGIDMMNLPIDLDNSDIDILEVNNKPELMQETHSNFLSLIRDIICSTTEHRMDFTALEKRLQTWQESPISPLNDWYSLSESWVGVLQSAINFLCGNATELPNDFVPYLEYKQQMNSYQWIGAGRDSDNLMAPLCKFWLDHRDELKTIKVKEEAEVELSNRTQTPPPPRCPTNWTMRKATPEEIQRFQEQEKRRYENPHRAFTYCCNGYESVVAPLKGIYNPAVGNAKARGHTILTADRPNFVTILSLVRDATARLPNGEGTRGDIVELLKHSQYISPTATDSVLQTVVSGALDRMHTQTDPCVKYDTKRKIWIYLHRNRSEEDFEKIHQHLQGVPKVPKKSNKKSPSKPKPKSSTDKTKVAKEVQPNAETVEKSKQLKKPNQALNVALSTSSLSSPKSNSLLICNNIQQREPSPPTIQILESVPSSPSKSQEDQEINEALQAIVDNQIASPKLTKSKGIVKIISPQTKSLIVSSNSQKQEKSISGNKATNQQQLVAQQLLQMSVNQKQTIQVFQKQTSEEADKKTKVPVTSQHQIIQTVTPQQLQTVKNVTLLRNSSPMQTPGLSSTAFTTSENSEIQSVTVTVSKSLSEQMVQPGIQIKTPNNLTPAQQQQILQTIKQKILPQTVLASQQQQLLKQKLAQVQKQNQNATPGISLLGQANKLNADNSTPKPGMVSTQTPVVAKVLTNAAGQVISVESLLAHQKQHGSLPQGTTLRVSGAKGGQPNIIQLTGASKQSAIAQFAVTSQNNLIALTTQPKLIVSTPSSSMVTSTITTKSVNRDRATSRSQQLTKLPSKVTQQLINAKIIQNIDGQKVVQPKLIVSQGTQMKLAASSAKNVNLQKPTLSIAANSNSIRMVNTANLNLTHIGGKPVLLASKGTTLQNIQGQNVILQTQPGSSGSLVLQNSKNLQTGNVSQNQGNINIINQQNVVLGSQVKMQQPQMVFKNNTINQVSQGHIVLGGQPVRLHTSNTPTTQRLVLASQGQGGQILAQQILLPAGFQGTAINIKALQGVKVIPLAQAHAQNKNIQSRQVFARVVNPTITAKVQQTTNLGDKPEETPSRDEV